MATIQETERVSSISSKQSAYSRSSVYQTNGKPLSEEAIYKAKLRYGVYNKPGAPVVGVENSASDSAALLATQTDLSVQPYKRDLSSEAATAALIAKTDSAPKAWKRENFAPDAEYAAISAKSIKFPFNSSISDHEDRESSEAASSVLKRDSSSVARDALQDLYAFDDIRNGTATFTQFDAQNLKNAAESSVATSLYNRSNVKPDYRSGITTKSSSMRLNIGDVHKQSSLNATQTMTSRTTPDRNASRSGLNTAKLDYAAGEVNISKITTAANESARKSLHNRFYNDQKDYRTGIPTRSDYIGQSLASSGAGASLQKGGFGDFASAERETLKHNTLVDKSVYAIAAANAGRTLSQLDNDATTKNLLYDRAAYTKALEIAQANHATRNQNSGKVNLGGGLLMDPKELELMASSIVKPILTDIDSKAVAQRKSDFDAAKQKQEQKQKREEYRQEQKRLKQEAIAKKEAEKKARKEKLEKEKGVEVGKQDDLKKEKTKEVKAQEDILTEKTKEQDAEQEALLTEKLEAEKKIADEANAKKEEREAELKAIQEEKDAIAAPILEEHKKETTTLDELITKREAADKLAAEQKERAETAEKELSELNAQLEETNSKIEAIKAELETTKEQSEKHSKEAELLKQESEAEVQSKQLKEQEFSANNEKLLAEKTDLQAKRAAALVSLQEAKKNAVAEELAIKSALPEHLQKEVNEDISDEDELDEDQFNTTDEEPEEEDTEKGKLQELGVATPTKTVLEGGEIKEQGKVDQKLSEKSKSKIQQKRDSSVKKSVESPHKKSWRSRVKGFLGTSSSKTPIEKKSTLASTSKKISEPKPVEVKPKTTSTKDEEVKDEEKNELKQTFSGFSQGSIPDEEGAEKKKDIETKNTSENDSILDEVDKSKSNTTGVFKEDI